MSNSMLSGNTSTRTSSTTELDPPGGPLNVRSSRTVRPENAERSTTAFEENGTPCCAKSARFSNFPSVERTSAVKTGCDGQTPKIQMIGDLVGGNVTSRDRTPAFRLSRFVPSSNGILKPANCVTRLMNAFAGSVQPFVPPSKPPFSRMFVAPETDHARVGAAAMPPASSFGAGHSAIAAPATAWKLEKATHASNRAFVMQLKL